MTTAEFLNDIPTETASRAYYGVSFHSERRGQSACSEYADTLAEDYAHFKEQAEKGKTLDLLDEEFARYRAGFLKRNLAFLHSNSRCVSWFIAGPSNFPASRMNKRSEIAHKRLNEMLDFRARAKAAIIRKLRPDLAPIYASDSDAVEQLTAKVIRAEADQAKMRATNATIRRFKKDGEQEQIAGLLAMGYRLAEATALLKPDCGGRIGFADYMLTNNGANIRRMKARIEQITQLQATPTTEAQGEKARFEDYPPDNRVRLWFDGKPEETLRTDLKRNGFRWTPSMGCWQAFRNWNSIATAKRIAGVV